jgi:hypothetical protein
LTTENVQSAASTVAPAAPNSRFTELEIEQGLMALALCSGNARKAERRLADLGMKVDHSTLHRWRDKHSEKYRSLQADLLPRLRTEAAERHSAVADREMEIGLSLLDQLDTEKAELPARDLSTAIRNLDVGQGIHRTKAAELRGDAPPPTVHISFEAQVRTLTARGARWFDGDGKPMTPEEAIAKHAAKALPAPTEQSDTEEQRNST